METVLVRVPLKTDHEDGFFLIEADVQEFPADVELAAAGDGTHHVVRAANSLTGALDGLKPALEIIVDRFHGLPSLTDVELKFGLKVGGEMGLFVAKGTAEAAFEVTLKWSQSGSE